MLLIGLMASTSAPMVFAEELPTVCSSEIALEPVTTIEEAPAETVSGKTKSDEVPTLEKITDDTSVTDKTEEIVVDDSVNVDEITSNDNIIDETVDSETDYEKNSEDEASFNLGDRTFEIIENEDGTKTRITYEYQLNEETGELELVEIECLDGNFDEDGNLIEDTVTDETIGKIISFSPLGVITFDREPEFDEVKSALPTTVTAIIKGEESNTEIEIAISFNDSEIENIISSISDENTNDTQMSFNLTASLTTDLSVADDVKNPSVEIRLVDEGTNFKYQTLESDGFRIEGMLPEEPSLSIEELSPEEAEIHESKLREHNNEFYENQDEHDGFDFLFIDSMYRIVITDKDGNVFVPTESLLITKTLSDESVSSIGDNQFTLVKGDEIIEHSFNADAKEISYLTDDLSESFVISGTKNVKYITVSFQICSVNGDTYFSTSGKYAVGEDVIVPEFYTNDVALKSAVNDIDWSDVDLIAMSDASYTKYIDTAAYDITKGEEIVVLEAESYGDVLAAADTTAETTRVNEITDTVDVIKPEDVAVVANEQIEKMTITEELITETK